MMHCHNQLCLRLTFSNHQQISQVSAKDSDPFRMLATILTIITLLTAALDSFVVVIEHRVLGFFYHDFLLLAGPFLSTT